jgi:hypothetical protein
MLQVHSTSVVTCHPSLNWVSGSDSNLHQPMASLRPVSLPSHTVCHNRIYRSSVLFSTQPSGTAAYCLFWRSKPQADSTRRSSGDAAKSGSYLASISRCSLPTRGIICVVGLVMGFRLDPPRVGWPAQVCGSTEKVGHHMDWRLLDVSCAKPNKPWIHGPAIAISKQLPGLGRILTMCPRLQPRT